MSTRRVWDLIRQRRIPAYKDGGRRYIARAALQEYVAAREAAAFAEDERIAS